MVTYGNITTQTRKSSNENFGKGSAPQGGGATQSSRNSANPKGRRVVKKVTKSRPARKKQSAPRKKNKMTSVKLDNKKVTFKKGAYKNMLGVDTIPLTFMRKVEKAKIGDMVSLKNKQHKVTKLMKQRNNLALTLMGKN